MPSGGLVVLLPRAATPGDRQEGASREGSDHGIAPHGNHQRLAGNVAEQRSPTAEVPEFSRDRLGARNLGGFFGAMAVSDGRLAGGRPSC